MTREGRQAGAPGGTVGGAAGRRGPASRARGLRAARLDADGQRRARLRRRSRSGSRRGRRGRRFLLASRREPRCLTAGLRAPGPFGRRRARAHRRDQHGHDRLHRARRASSSRAIGAGRVAGWMWAAYAPSVLALRSDATRSTSRRSASPRSPTSGCARRASGASFTSRRQGSRSGLGVLTRPSMVSVAPVVAAAWALAAHRQPLARRAIAAGGAAAVCIGLACVLPVCAHDARCGAGWTVSTNNERNLFLGNNPYTPDYKTSHLGQRSLDELEPGTRRYLESFYARVDERAAMQHAAIDYMRRHPARTSLRTLNRATSFWGFDYLASREIQSWRGGTTAATLAAAGPRGRELSGGRRARHRRRLRDAGRRPALVGAGGFCRSPSRTSCPIRSRSREARTTSP